MNFYPFHVGDYASHTAHLEPMEDLAYRRMLDLYYLGEGELPLSIEALARLIRMRGFLAEVKVVLDEFFVQTPTGWMHERCNQELDHMRDKQAKAKASAAASVAARSTGVKPEPKTNLVLVKPPVNERSTDAERTLSERSTDAELPIPIPIPVLNTVVTSSLVETGEPVVDLTPQKARIPCPADELLALFHEKCPALPRVLMLNSTRRRHLVSRWRDVDAADKLADKAEGVAIFAHVFSQVQRSDFLCGRTQNKNGRLWKASFDWLFLPTNFLKVCEGHYDNERRTA